MTDDEIYQIWAPPRARWSPWVKPVLFSSGDLAPIAAESAALPDDWDFSWLPLPLTEEHFALVLDLPSAEAITAGLDFARRGFRPVPLYNAVPDFTAQMLVDVMPILRALKAATPDLATLALPDEAPPMFLLDSKRRFAPHRPLADTAFFDNRSISFPTDFPSANFLLAHGIRRAVLVQRGASQPAADLAHTLCAWQLAGIRIELKQVEVSGPPALCDVPAPHRFGKWFYRALELFGFRRHVLGGFGGLLSDGPSGG